MTYKELSKCNQIQLQIDKLKRSLYRLTESAEHDRSRIQNLHTRAVCPSSPNISMIPTGSGYNGACKIERLIDESCDIQDTIQLKEKRRQQIIAAIKDKEIMYFAEQLKLWRYIASIPDSKLRVIFSMRFLDGMPWYKIALDLGGQHSEDSVKKLCQRYIETKHE